MKKERFNLPFIAGCSVISVLFIIFMTIGIRYYISHKGYVFYLHTNFFENIVIDTKVRLNAGFVIGTVTNIISNLHTHTIQLRLKPGITIPKFGSRAKVETWGFFGEKFVNISVTPLRGFMEFYAPNDTMPLDVNDGFKKNIATFNKLFSKKDQNTTFLDQNAMEIKHTIYRLQRNIMAPRRGMAHKIQNTLRKYNTILDTDLMILDKSTKELQKMLGLIHYNTSNTKAQLPKITALVRLTASYLSHHQEDNWFGGSLNENRYDTWSAYTIMMSKNLHVWSKYPYKLLNN